MRELVAEGLRTPASEAEREAKALDIISDALGLAYEGMSPQAKEVLDELRKAGVLK